MATIPVRRRERRDFTNSKNKMKKQTVYDFTYGYKLGSRPLDGKPIVNCPDCGRMGQADHFYPRGGLPEFTIVIHRKELFIDDVWNIVDACYTKGIIV